jgi:hypothetical protein
MLYATEPNPPFAGGMPSEQIKSQMRIPMKDHTTRRCAAFLIAALALLSRGPSATAETKKPSVTQANCVTEVTLTSEKSYPNPFMDVTLDALITAPDGRQLKVPAFWAGGNEWRFRYASGSVGMHTWRTECSDPENPQLHGVEGKIEVVAYRGENPLYRHGPIQVAEDHRHFAHADGTPFFWLGDTWWKGLCKRMTWEGFQELTANRKAKGFSVVQIVCGPYPDEGSFEPRWENEGGKPYETRDFTVVNPKYFDYADRRIQHLVDAGIVPAIVGAWGRSDCNSMKNVGAAGLKRHWRNLVARYGAYPVVWILGGEIADETKWGRGPWAEVATYLRGIDPYQRLLTCHTSPGRGRRGASGDVNTIDFDMIGGSHDATEAIAGKTLAILTSACATTPPMPVLCGETCYEGIMQQGFGDVERHMFWMYMLNGAAGHTYGAAGVWQASVDGDPGITPVYDWTTWRQGMNYPGSTQLGLAKKLLEKYPWWRFEPHPEWVEPGCYAAGIPGEVRFIYLPRRNIYNWSGPTVKNLEPDVDWHAYYFDPATGRQFDLGTMKAKAKAGDPVGAPVDFKRNLPSPQDWVLVLERNHDTRRAIISNVEPRRDIHGEIIDAHDGCMEYFNGQFYLYGVQFRKGNGFGNSNRYVCYSSPDLMAWTPHGEMIKELDANPRTFAQCYVKFNRRTGKYVMWYNAAGQNGVAVADRPDGPFVLVNANVQLTHTDIQVGDMSLFVDDDGTCYLVQSDGMAGFGVQVEPIPHHQVCVEKLTPDYLGTTGEITGFVTGNCEGPSMFKRGNTYYLLTDNTCCYCPEGTGVRVYTAPSPMGPFTYRGNINVQAGSTRDLPRTWTSPGTGRNDCIITAQGKHVAAVPTPSGVVFLWMGDRWGTAPDGVKGHDFQYWSSPFQFESDGMIKQMKWEDQWTLELPQTPKS